MTDREQFFRHLYRAFNARDLETTLAVMHPDVEWANGMEGGHVHGPEEIRAYWTRQWGLIDPYVEPIGFSTEPDGGVVVEVQQVVRDLGGKVLFNQVIEHIYRIEDGLIRRMDIRRP